MDNYATLLVRFNQIQIQRKINVLSCGVLVLNVSFTLPADGLQFGHDLRPDAHLFSKVSGKRVLVLLLVGEVARLQSAQPLVSERADMKRFGVNIGVFIIWDVWVGSRRELGRRHVFLPTQCAEHHG